MWGTICFKPQSAGEQQHSRTVRFTTRQKTAKRRTDIYFDKTVWIETCQDAFIGFISFSWLTKVNNQGQEELEKLHYVSGTLSFCHCVWERVASAGSRAPPPLFLNQSTGLTDLTSDCEGWGWGGWSSCDGSDEDRAECWGFQWNVSNKTQHLSHPSGHF